MMLAGKKVMAPMVAKGALRIGRRLLRRGEEFRHDLAILAFKEREIIYPDVLYIVTLPKIPKPELDVCSSAKYTPNREFTLT
jgi:hypothetical protein